MTTPTNRLERFALAVLLFILAGVPVALLGYQYFVRLALSPVRVIDITAAAPEAGGFQPDAIRVAAGETVRLRFSVPDVTHGIAIGPGLGIDIGHVDPGQVREVEVTFDRPGRYTVYCNTWCSPNHWRMRGTIEVYDPSQPDALPPSQPPDPALESLAARGINIDAEHPAETIPDTPPSPGRGAEITATHQNTLPADLFNPAWRQQHSPVEAWSMLVAHGMNQPDAWDVVAHLWTSSLQGDRLAQASTLYAKNCAACHGEDGSGTGPGAAVLQAQHALEHSDMPQAGKPTAFADPRIMLGGRSEIYYAKIRRGGMGTGMPGFGQIFTPEESWMLAEYLWRFVFVPAENRP